MSFAAPLVITRQTLPHWVQPGATYYFNYRMADSLPQALLADWLHARSAWMEHHPSPWSVSDALEYETRFTARMDAWLDAGMGSCALRCSEVRQQVVDCLTKFDDVRLDLDCAVVMPNHVHVVLKPRAQLDVFKLIAGMKGASARACNAMLSRTGEAFWMEDSYNRVVRDAEELSAFRTYIARNPVEAKLSAGEFTLIENHVLVP